MKYFFPDSQDLVDPSFDFTRERRAVDRLRQRDDIYAHEVFSTPAFDGLLVSKGIVDGYAGLGSRYTMAQRHRLLRDGAPSFLRTERPDGRRLPVIGDCGAFTYVKEKLPPYTVESVLGFYEQCRFDFGISVDHVILGFSATDDVDPALLNDWKERQELTLDLARDFLAGHRTARLAFKPLGVAQGWSPRSYAEAVVALQKMGYDYIALGGMVPLKTPEIIACLRAIAQVRATTTRLHLLGVTRIEQVTAFADYGVESFDSTAPLRQAFKDDKNNYYTLDGAFTAIRIPQVQGNPSLQKRIAAGQIQQEKARRLEKACLGVMQDYATGAADLEEAVELLCEYEKLYDPKKDHSEAYRTTLAARPWEQCSCEVCSELGHHVIIFRGAERNRRRGFHNIHVFYRRLGLQLGTLTPTETTAGIRTRAV